MGVNSSVTIYGIKSANPIRKEVISEKNKQYGVGFPFGSKLTGGYFHKDSGIAATKANLQQLLLTERGERIMLPNYGVSLKKYLFEPLDEKTFEGIKNEIATSIAKYAVGVQLLRIRVLPLDGFGTTETNGFKLELNLKLLEEEEAIFDVDINIE